MADITAWEENLEKLKNGVFGAETSLEALARYWKAQAEAGYPGANDNFMYFSQLIGGNEVKEEQLDDMDIVVLQCYRNKYKAEEHDTEQGIIANAIDKVLPILFAVRNGDYRKASEVAREIFEEIEKLFLNNHIESFQNFHDEWGYRFKPNTITEYTELKKKFTEDGNGT